MKYVHTHSTYAGLSLYILCICCESAFCLSSTKIPQQFTTLTTKNSVVLQTMKDFIFELFAVVHYFSKIPGCTVGLVRETSPGF